jgi:NAD(P)-dependent dehydrogenase (short-subunit alcohol dehydrogenase family)
VPPYLAPFVSAQTLIAGRAARLVTITVSRGRVPMGAPQLFDLTGKVAVVTGGSRGIGRGIAAGLAGAGATVVVASRKLEKCEEVTKAIEAETGRRAVPFAFHAGHWDEAELLCAFVYAELGRCDVLVNNAAIAPTYSDPAAITQELWDKTIAVNVRGPFRLSMLIASRMKAAGGGSIVNVSGPSRQPKPDGIVYGISKGALDTLTLAIAATFGPTVRANTIYPGMIETEMVAAWEGKEAFIATTGLERLGQPGDFVGTVVYLASDASSHVTCGSLTVQ